MSSLADAVLPLIRTRGDVWRWDAADAQGDRMHDAIDILERELPSADPQEAYAVVHKALASAVKVIARADDSSGVIGGACQRLLDQVTEETRWTGPHAHEYGVLEWNERRLAVFDRNVDEIIRTHARGRKVAAMFDDTAHALEEIGEIELAILWARMATEFDLGHQSLRASEYWCELLESHHPDEVAAARQMLFDRWPSAATASRLRRAAGRNWVELEDAVIETLSGQPNEAVTFVLDDLKDAGRAWRMAHDLAVTSDPVWSNLLKKYEAIEPLATLDVHRRLVETALQKAEVRNYSLAALRLARMRTLAKGTDRSDEVARFIAELREQHRRRPRLQQEFDRARLP